MSGKVKIIVDVSEPKPAKPTEPRGFAVWLHRISETVFQVRGKYAEEVPADRSSGYYLATFYTERGIVPGNGLDKTIVPYPIDERGTLRVSPC